MSNIKCCVPGCENSGGSHVPLHKFPNPKKDLTLFNTWLSAIGGPILELENSHIFKYRRVCHQHFEEKYWCRNNRLSNIAEPTLNMPGSVTLPEPAAGERRPLVSIEHLTEPSTSKGSLTLPVPAAGERRPLVSIENLTKPSTSKGSLTLPVPAAGERRPLVSIENLTKPSTSKGSLTLPEPAAGERRPLVSIENLTEPSTSKELHTEESLKVTAHTQKRLSASPAEHHLYQRIIKLGVKLSKYRNKNKKHMMKLKTLQNMTTNPHFQKIMDTMTSTAKILTYMQFRESKKKNKGHRFTLQEKILSLSILKQSPKGYRFLRKIFVLPAPQTLLKLLQQADINPGINENILNQIKKVTRKLKIEERLCIVIFDEMSLKANVTYNERKDRVTGFVNNGHETKPDYADHAQVFMIRGLIKNYKQPVAYTFSQAATKGPELAKQLKSIIIQLQDAGLMVVATVCDQGTNNVQCYKILLQETQTALLRKGQEPRENKFIVNGYEIVPLYDPPHLMKCIRNNLLTKDLQYKKNKQCKTAKWQHIRNLYNENPGYQGIRLVPKLTDSHVIPSKISKMKVKYATQVFSQTVATNMGYLADKGILPPECRDTADVLLFFDALFDSVNGSYNKKQKHGKPLLGAATPRSAHHETWRESKKILKDMK